MSNLAGFIAALKTVGIGVGLVVLVGSGGRSRAAEHVEATSSLVGALPLGRGDLISLVDRRLLEAEEVGEIDADRLSDEEADAQAAEFRRRLAAAGGSNGPRVVPYNPDRRWT